MGVGSAAAGKRHEDLRAFGDGLGDLDALGDDTEVSHKAQHLTKRSKRGARESVGAKRREVAGCEGVGGEAERGKKSRQNSASLT